jgi:tripartite-type tricarboxylate transporter receptor subunit TctC
MVTRYQAVSPRAASALLQRVFLCMLVALYGIPNSQAQTAAAYPNRPIRFIVPYAAGGSTSHVARLVAGKLTEAWGQQVNVDNRPGANTVIGSDALVRSPPDGYTISLAASTHATVPHLIASLPYDPIKDFTPVASMVTTQLVLVLHPSVPARDLKEFIALAKAKPNELNFAAGTAPALTDLIGGQIQLNFDTPVTSIPHIQSGRLKAIAITGKSRLPALPDVPTFAEAGLPEYDVQLWFGVLAPAGTPPDIVEKLSVQIGKILAMPDVKQQLTAQGLDVSYRSPEQFGALIRVDLERFGKVIRAAGIKIE